MSVLEWTKAERDLLIYGHPFSVFGQKWLGSEAEYWAHLHPPVQHGNAGWIGKDEIEWLSAKLIKDEPRLNEILFVREFPIERTKYTYALAKQMLNAAKKAGQDLCVIIG